MTNSLKKKKSKLLKVHVKREDLDKTFVGFCEAVEWLACCGKRVTVDLYNRLTDQAAAALVAELANMPPAFAREVAEGIETKNPVAGNVSIPHGLWGSVHATEEQELEDAEKPFRLYLGDEESEWGGELVSRNGVAYTRLRLRAQLVLEVSERTKLPSHTARFFTARKSRRFSETEVQVWLENASANAPEDLRPLTIGGLEELVRERFLNASHDIARKTARKIQTSSKRGPKGPRNPNRKQILIEYRHKLFPAELRN